MGEDEILLFEIQYQQQKEKVQFILHYCICIVSNPTGLLPFEAL